MEEIVEYVPLLGFQRYRPYFDDGPTPTMKAKDLDPIITEADAEVHDISQPQQMLTINLGAAILCDDIHNSPNTSTSPDSIRQDCHLPGGGVKSNHQSHKKSSKSRWFSLAGQWYQRRRIGVVN
ncbi:uncharacterized protein N7469_005533 [Penicillium citrinum]|uniref:Uncharacterized protein n=2 Tax=Penicillium TaxID=5073 RepID=A0A9W9TPE3_PENCI|nr:uncharacterized protein N7469_005533 [Penicillium citrinum]KAJ5233767.1 hypothetical protein N7469_005533 [Penicillium citrinum]KAJ5572763.1 hypothetical protein N7450_009747 [Penicillium hetheringtonii]